MDSPVPPAPDSDEKPTADNPRHRSVLSNLGGLLSYFAAIATTVVILFYGMRFSECDLGGGYGAPFSFESSDADRVYIGHALAAPFSYDHDALLILPLVKATVERGSHWRNERLGAPGIQELHDFPIIDHLHFWVIWWIGTYAKDPVVTFNLFYLATYPLTTLIGMFVLRRFGMSLPAAGAAGILYAFQPYHYQRGEVHYFLSAYYIVPLSLLLVLRICQGRLPFFPATANGGCQFRFRDRFGWIGVLISAATACAGAYYAFFACVFLAAGGVFAWYSMRTWRAAASAVAMIAVIGLGGVLNHVPAFYYQYEYGHNARPTLRYSEEAENYGMKIAQLVLPVGGHNWRPLTRIRSEYNDQELRPAHSENEWDAFGIVGSVGFVGLLVYAFLPTQKRWPFGALAALTLFATIYGTVGGLSSVFNHLFTAQIRAPNRISIYIVFLALFAAVAVVDRLFDYFAERRDLARFLRWPAFFAIIAFGLWDQLNNTWFKPDGMAKSREVVRAKFERDREFFGVVERLLEQSESQIPPKFRDGKPAAIFVLPYMHFPESQPHQSVKSYDHVRGYIHTSELRWSYGAMIGREWDQRFRSLVDEPWATLVTRLVAMGFRGLLVDMRGYAPKELEEMNKQLLDGPLGNTVPRHPLPDNYIFYDLTPFMVTLMQTPALYKNNQWNEFHSIVPLWLKGFVTYDAGGQNTRRVECETQGTLILVNPADYPRHVRIEMEVSVFSKKECPLTIRGSVWNDEISDLNETPKKYDKVIELPPGHNRVNFRCPPPADYVFSGAHKSFLIVTNFKIVEVPKPD